jgi:hypothetical protein
MIAPNSYEEGRRDMASGAKRKTTFAKLQREQKLRERRLDKQAKKDARKRNPEGDSGQAVEVTPAESEE